VDEVCKTVEKGYVLVDVFEFWKYRVSHYWKSDNSGGLFAQYVNMFLKLKQESSGYPSWSQVRITRTDTLTTGAQRALL
jgi:hypothetical protein